MSGDYKKKETKKSSKEKAEDQESSVITIFFTKLHGSFEAHAQFKRLILLNARSGMQRASAQERHAAVMYSGHRDS